MINQEFTGTLPGRHAAFDYHPPARYPLRMSHLIHSAIDIPEETRTKVIELINQSVATSIDLQLQIKQAHWNLRGPNFIAVHELLDKIEEEVEVGTDLLAERISQLAGVAEGIVQRVNTRTQLPEYPLDIHDSMKHLEALTRAFSIFAKHLRRSIDQTDGLGDKDSADIYTEVSRVIDKNLWFIEAHLYKGH